LCTRPAPTAFEQLFEELPGRSADAIAVIGYLGAPWSRADTYPAIFRVLVKGGRPTFWVPGATDPPLRDYLRESYDVEIAYPHLRGVHGAVALAPGASRSSCSRHRLPTRAYVSRAAGCSPS